VALKQQAIGRSRLLHSPGSPASSDSGAAPISGYLAHARPESVDSPMSSSCRGGRVSLEEGGRRSEDSGRLPIGREASGGERRRGGHLGALFPGSPPRFFSMRRGGVSK
jgi:hypothetical protein